MNLSPADISVAINQAYMYGLVTLIIIAVSMCGAFFMLWKAHNRAALGEFWALTVLVFFIVVGFSLYCLADSVCGMMYPEHYALKNLLGMVGK